MSAQTLGIPVHTVFGIGRNYSEHARELGNALPEEPIVFIKPLSALIYSGDEFQIPAFSAHVDYECELVVLLSQGGRDLTPDQAKKSLAGVSVGIDFTARDLQTRAKKNGLPWTTAKGFDGSAAVGSFSPISKIQDPLDALFFELNVNGERRQLGHVREMLWGIEMLVCYLSSRFTLFSGDLIYTGTPSGVGRVAPGDSLTAVAKGPKSGEISRLELRVRS